MSVGRWQRRGWKERRLLYVAMTRARDDLHLIVPQRFFAHSQRHNGDRHMYAARTRFIPAEILKFFEVCNWPTADAAAKRESQRLRRWTSEPSCAACGRVKICSRGVMQFCIPESDLAE
jgi:ATP-dependent exoDNAse (exonuclease V) beta subunit